MSDASDTPAIEPTNGRTLVFVCHGPSCSERGSPENYRKLKERIAESPARRTVRVCETTCLDNCATGPNVAISHEAHIRSGVRGAELDILLDFLVGGITDATD